MFKIPKLKPLVARIAHAVAPAHDHGRLIDLPPPADNPGRLAARAYVPAGLARQAALVVVLHGCTQTAAGYDRGSGWSRLADRHGFALLYPEQVRANNPNGCFNWFQPADTRRGGGEAASIAAMIRRAIAAHAIDPARVFVTGLSAGGAMTAAMLAAYPDLFAAGAVIAGLPVGAASGVPQAFEAMAAGGAPVDAATLGDRVRAASGHARTWPRLSVWHGDADRTVAAANGDALVCQWTNVHGLPAQATRTDHADGHRRSVWEGADGAVLVEHVAIEGMGHGTPLRPGTGPGEAGEAGAYMLDVGISSTDRIAAFFGLAEGETERSVAEIGCDHRRSAAPMIDDRASASSVGVAGGPQKVIEDALRAAGLMR